MKRAGRCIHFNGIQNKCCDADVDYETVTIYISDKMPSRPCMVAHNKDGAKCDKFQLPTAEEIAASKASIKKSFEDVSKTRAAIVLHLGGPWKRGSPSAAGVINCPICGKSESLKFSRAGYNGHIHASCQTPDCVSWME